MKRRPVIVPAPEQLLTVSEFASLVLLATGVNAGHGSVLVGLLACASLRSGWTVLVRHLLCGFSRT